MQKLLGQAQALIAAGQTDEAVALLCEVGPPSETAVCELIATAYQQRSATRGDIFAAKVFAQRALTQGSRQPLMAQIVAATRQDQPLSSGMKPQAYQLGGWNEQRRPIAAPLAACALSRLLGTADQPKDFAWLEQNIPCQKACPAATDIPGYLAAIYAGRHAEAYRINLRDNVFPAVLGRVCSRPCEAECRHGWDGLGDQVAICFSKRAAADFKDQGLVVLDPWFAPSGKRVAIVGSGVAGLAAARQLALLGHQVRVYEKHSRPGGMLNQGIPIFRLPREIIDQEIAQIVALGVEIVCNTAIGESLTLTELATEYDAVVLAAGTLRPNQLDLPGRELKGIRHGLDFLLEVNTTGGSDIGEKVVVIGGGFTAMDCARTARRLEAATVQLEAELAETTAPGSILRMAREQVQVLYRRSVEEMLVTPGELEELEHEQIPLHCMVAPRAFVGENGRITAMRLVRTELGPPDASGRRRPVEVCGSEFEIPVDTVLLATGQFPDTRWIDEGWRDRLVQDDGWLKSGASHTTAGENIFVAGDFATGARSLIEAIGHAKECVGVVDRFLTGHERLKAVAQIEDVTASGRIREMDAVPRQAMPATPLSQRDLQTEVDLGFSAETAGDEAQRCYLCHFKYEIDSDKCIYCDWCIKVKPRPECILKVQKLHYDPQGRPTGWDIARRDDEVSLIWINQADCIRCGACVDACPVDAISVQKVSLHCGGPVASPRSTPA
ncbi:MAG: FAD-dependent oxidoreductase [Desulfuromonadales bacterium]|nr:FAD-dependent oxidoreductase [Desulfuromonadales bacterium]